MFQNLSEDTIDLNGKNEVKEEKSKFNIFRKCICKRKYSNIYCSIYVVICFFRGRILNI